MERPKRDMDERVNLPLDPEVAVRALLETEPVDDNDADEDAPTAP